jgi:hypothetical protein
MKCRVCQVELTTVRESVVGRCDSCTEQVNEMSKMQERELELMRDTLAKKGKAIVAGDAAKNEAIGRVLDGADPAWVDEALRAVFWVASRKERFTTDDVWEQGITSPEEPRAMGAVMRVAESQGWIEPTRDHWLSRRPVCHRRPLRVWQSRLRGEGEAHGTS